MGCIEFEFATEDLALLLRQALGCSFNGDDREALAAGTRELLLRLMADVTHYGHQE
jgi:hypothetical protein